LLLKKLIDFPCSHENAVGFSEEIINQTALSFPDSYNNCTALTTLAVAMKKAMNFPFCLLPFCNTVEAEALGGKINLGDGRIGPRGKEHVRANVEDLLQTPPINFNEGRIHQVLLACSLLKERGEKVALEICGPYTILNCLLDIALLFKAWRKDPQVAEDVLGLISNNLLSYLESACAAGVDIISYADPAGSLKILGPRYAEKTALLFTVPFLQKARDITAGKCLIHLCPKTTMILTGLDLVQIGNIAIPKHLSYPEAALSVIGEADIIGQACLKEDSLVGNGTLKAIRFK